MPEGHSIHRHARILTELYAGRIVHTSSPQGRFDAGAQLLDGLVAGRAQAWGKHLLWPFLSPAQFEELCATGADEEFRATDPRPTTGPGQPNNQSQATVPGMVGESNIPCRASRAGEESIRLGDERAVWLQIHLGLYGKWAFAGEAVEGLGGAGIRLAPAEDSGMMAVMRRATDHGRDMTTSLADPSGAQDLIPTATTRLRIEGEASVAHLTGPAQCNILTGAEVLEKIANLGPDPIRNEPGDRKRFITAARGRKIPAGQAVMDQSIVAGPGNIYRAECLWHVGISPHRAADRVSAKRWGELWDDLSAYMKKDIDTGIIITIPPEYQPDPIPDDDPELSRFVAYHRTGKPCVRCGAKISEAKMAGRRLFWCPSCQR